MTRPYLEEQDWLDRLLDYTNNDEKDDDDDE